MSLSDVEDLHTIGDFWQIEALNDSSAHVHQSKTKQTAP